MKIHAFQGFEPAADRVEKVNCVPYDVVNTEEAAALALGNPDSLLHVDRAEIDLPDATNPYDDAVYEKAKQNFESLQSNGALIPAAAPCVYLYRQIMGNHRQTGLAVACRLEDYENGLIKKHEKTRPDKEDDRTRLIDTIGAQTSPILLTYRGGKELQMLAKMTELKPPTFDFTAPDGVRHTVWRITGAEEQAFIKAFESIPCIYIADGHHRAASAERVRQLRKTRNTHHTGEEAYNRVLSVLFPSDELNILAYNRCVRDLNGLSAEQFLETVKQTFTVSENASPQPERPGQVRMYVNKQWYGLEFKPDSQADPVSKLDVSVLQEKLLAPVLGIDDPRTNPRIDFIGGIRGTAELVRLVDSGKAEVAFSMFPTTVEQMMDIADAGQIMPPKSTWFEPKLRSGFFIHRIDE